MVKQIITYYCYNCNEKQGCVKVYKGVHNDFKCDECPNPDNCNSDGNIEMPNYTHKC